MCEIHITATKPTGQLFNKFYFVYIDGTMYKCSSAEKSLLIVKVTPTLHQIKVSFYESKSKDKASKLGDAASNMGSLVAARAKTRNGAGIALGIGTMAWGISKMSSAMMGKSEDCVEINMSSQKILKLKITANSLGKIKLTEE